MCRRKDHFQTNQMYIVVEVLETSRVNVALNELRGGTAEPCTVCSL